MLTCAITMTHNAVGVEGCWTAAHVRPDCSMGPIRVPNDSHWRINRADWVGEQYNDWVSKTPLKRTPQTFSLFEDPAGVLSPFRKGIRGIPITMTHPNHWTSCNHWSSCNHWTYCNRYASQCSKGLSPFFLLTHNCPRNEKQACGSVGVRGWAWHSCRAAADFY